MAASYGVSVDLSGLLWHYAGLTQQLYPLLAQAVEATAAEGAYRWKDAVNKARLWSVEKEGYVESISWRMTGPYSAEISAGYDKAQEIEDGRPARDLKRMLQTSRKTRVVKSGPHRGQRYLIIPFRHNTPTASGEGAHAPQMPKKVYAMAKGLSASFVLPPGSKKAATRLSGSGHVVAQHSYEWGERLPAGLAPKVKEHHATDPYAGMVRFQTSTGKGKSSAYLTFRVMTEWSSGWVVPAKPGLKLAEKVAGELQQSLDANVGQAITLGMLRRS